MVSRWRFFGDFFASCISASPVQQVSDLHPKFALRPHHMCGSMVNIQCGTAEIRRGKKKEEDRRNHRAKIQCPHVLCRAAIIKKRKNIKRNLTYANNKLNCTRLGRMPLCLLRLERWQMWSIVMSLSVCVSVCRRGYIRYHTRGLCHFLCLLPMSVARSSSGMLTIGSARRGQSVIYDCLAAVLYYYYFFLNFND